MKLIQTTFYAGLITVIRVASGFIASKMVAIFAGPSGMYLIGQFSNLVTISTTLSTGAINNGVIKYVSEYNEEPEKQRDIIQASVKLTLLCSAITGLILILGSSYWSQLIFQSGEYNLLIIIFGATLVLFALNTLIISILNGFGEIKKYTIVTSSSTIIGLILTIVLVYYFEAMGALYSLFLAPSLVFFVSIYLIKKDKWVELKIKNLRISGETLKKLSRFSLMAIVTALTIPLTQILLRGFIVNETGEESAGLWQGMLRVSDGYLMVVTTALSTYYLPKLSSLKEVWEIKKEIKKGYLLMIPVLILMLSSIYFLRNIIISILYTKDFQLMSELFLYQLLGDFFKMLSWILAYLMLSKSLTKVFIISEISFNLLYITFGYYLIHELGTKGVTISYLMSYILYFTFVAIYFRKYLF